MRFYERCLDVHIFSGFFLKTLGEDVRATIGKCCQASASNQRRDMVQYLAVPKRMEKCFF